MTKVKLFLFVSSFYTQESCGLGKRTTMTRKKREIDQAKYQSKIIFRYISFEFLKSTTLITQSGLKPVSKQMSIDNHHARIFII